ncbi:MAG: energy-coupling factor transporter transmembrane protein EcfT [Anaerolineae bacterium]|nr:energy-coupling factor transporter transmembrane protein EcfT [Anaerolineae bacterium]
MMNIDMRTRKSPMQKLDGRTKLIALSVIFVLVLLFSHPAYILALLGVVMVIWWSAKLPLQTIKDLFKYFLVIAVIILVVQIFFYPGQTELIRLSNPVPAIGFSGFITLEGILFGVAMVLRLVVIMIVAPLMVLTTPLPELMLALVKLKIPYRFAFIMTTALSLLPSIQSHAAIIQQAQLCRGITYDTAGKFFTKLRASVALLVPLILGSFRDSQTLEIAMSSRAFGAPVKRTFLLDSQFSKIDYLILAVTIAILVTGIVLRILGFGVY